MRRTPPPSKGRRRRNRKKDGVYGWRSQSKDRNLTSVILKGYTEDVLSISSLTDIVERISKTTKPKPNSMHFS
jgi:hypothetical protein